MPNTAQREVINHYQAYNVPAQWFESPADPRGAIEVIAVGDDFVWSFTIDADGDYASQEAPLVAPGAGVVVAFQVDPVDPTVTRQVEVGDWETGITV